MNVDGPHAGRVGALAALPSNPQPLLKRVSVRYSCDVQHGGDQCVARTYGVRSKMVMLATLRSINGHACHTTHHQTPAH